MAISPVFSAARRALLAHETALAVTGNNIANVNTPGYSRQVAELASDAPTPIGLGTLVGGGVHVARVTQVVDPLLARRLAAAATDRQQEGVLEEQLKALAETLNDLGTPSLGSGISGFFDAADALARNPTGLAERETFLGRANGLADELNRRSAEVASVQRSANSQLLTSAARATDLLGQIAKLNDGIRAGDLDGSPASELRDQRQQAVLELSGLLGINTVEDEHGALTVSAAGDGLVLVTGADVLHSVGTRAVSGGLDGAQIHEVGAVDANGNFLRVPDDFATGELGALTAARDTHAVATSAALDSLATTLRDSVNAIQTAASAVDLDGNPTAAVPLFGGTGAGNLSVLVTDARQIAAALSTQPGDNQNALRLADLRTTPQAALGNATFSAYLAQQEALVGENAARTGDAATAADGFFQQLEAQRASISGVNLNEELTNLLKYQRAFQAASKVISVADAMLAELFDAV
jgi:flagellar hook-associated protein 1 FlgK